MREQAALVQAHPVTVPFFTCLGEWKGCEGIVYTEGWQMELMETQSNSWVRLSCITCGRARLPGEGCAELGSAARAPPNSFLIPTAAGTAPGAKGLPREPPCGGGPDGGGGRGGGPEASGLACLAANPSIT